MDTKIWIMSAIAVSVFGNAWLSTSHAAEGTASPEAVKNLGAVLIKAYTFEPIHPNLPDHLWLDAGNGRVQFMMFDKPVSDPAAKLLFVGEGVKGRFCAESQPDHGKTGFNHFHRTNIPATGDMSMHGAKGEEGYWLKHVAVADFEMGPHGEHSAHGETKHYKPGTVQDVPQPPTPKCK